MSARGRGRVSHREVRPWAARSGRPAASSKRAASLDGPGPVTARRQDPDGPIQVAEGHPAADLDVVQPAAQVGGQRVVDLLLAEAAEVVEGIRQLAPRHEGLGLMASCPAARQWPRLPARQSRYTCSSRSVAASSSLRS